jgi:protocatechuate 3,4-dioxygenase beta subunit
MNDRPPCNESRRRFIKRASFFAAALPAGLIVGNFCQAPAGRQGRAPGAIVGGGCDGCEAIYDGMPERLSWQTRIAPDSEPGEPLEVGGVIYRRDGKTPAPGVILYVYHTDAKGFYSPAPGASGPARRHGHLRGWVKTGAGGEYKFRSIRPAPYPNARNPAHIHPVVKETDKNEYYIDEYLFDDDPLLTEQARARLENRGGSGVIHLSRSGGVWVGRRDIVLGLNIPNYE